MVDGRSINLTDFSKYRALIICVVAEHILMIIKGCLAVLIPSTPNYVVDRMEARAYRRAKQNKKVKQKDIALNAKEMAKSQSVMASLNLGNIETGQKKLLFGNIQESIISEKKILDSKDSLLKSQNGLRKDSYDTKEKPSPKRMTESQWKLDGDDEPRVESGNSQSKQSNNVISTTGNNSEVNILNN